jgi:hypothetical protein
MVAQFSESLKTGKIAEAFAEEYFKKQNINYQDVRNNQEYRDIDVDYLTDKLGKVEVKYNLVDALKGKQGFFVWWELEVGDKPGWWYKSKADYFLFFSDKGSGILIKNDDNLKQIIEWAIENGDHSFNGDNRFDYKQDRRWNEIITAKSMRYYLEDLKKNVDILHFVKRKNLKII